MAVVVGGKYDWGNLMQFPCANQFFNVKSVTEAPRKNSDNSEGTASFEVERLLFLEVSVSLPSCMTYLNSTKKDTLLISFVFVKQRFHHADD